MVSLEELKFKETGTWECLDPENCKLNHNEAPYGEPEHHYGCSCRDCMDFYWSLKH